MSKAPERRHMYGQEDECRVGRLDEALVAVGEHEQAEKGDHGYDEEGRSDESQLQIEKHDDRDDNDDGKDGEHVEDKRGILEREAGMRLQPAGVGEVGHGVVSASLAAGAVFGCAVLFPVERALVQALALLAAYPCLGALFYVGYRRWGYHLGAPPQFGAVCYGFALASWFLMVSGDPVVQRGAFWLAQTGLVLSGVSIACGLAMVAAALDTDWRGAVGVVMEADRAVARRLQGGEGGR